jgi:hypothetical protein
VFEEVSEAGAALTFVGRSHVVPQVYGDEGKSVVLVKDDVEPVFQLVFLVLNLRQGGFGGLGLLRQDYGGKKQDQA